MSRTGTAFTVGLIALVAGVTPVLAGSITLLEANFDDKTVDVAIGTSGPEANEPAWVDPSVVATVRDAPFPTPCLEVTDNHELTAGAAVFEFVNDIEAVDGVVTFEADLWFGMLETYQILVREHGGASQSFISIRTSDAGAVTYSGALPGGPIGTYEVGRVYNLRIVFRLDEGTQDIWWDGVQVVADHDYGITGRGVGSFYFGLRHDADMDGAMYVDNIRVLGEGVTPVDETSWTEVKNSYRE